MTVGTKPQANSKLRPNLPSYEPEHLNNASLHELETLVQTHSELCLKQAASFLNCSLPKAEVQCNLRGRAAGQLRYQRHAIAKTPILRFNGKLLSQNRIAFFQEVIPHEVAHLAAYSAFGTAIKPHGKEWRYVMNQCFGLVARVTHNFEVELKPRKRFNYVCGCPELEHELSIIRHNRVQRGQNQYLCRRCQQVLRYQAVKP